VATRPLDDRRLRRFATLVSAGAALVALSGFTAWAAVSTISSTTRAGAESRLSTAYGRAQTALTQIELDERGYRLQPSPRLRGQLNGAVADLRTALAAIATSGDARDRALVRSVDLRMGGITGALDGMVAAAQRFDAAAVARINDHQLQPRLGDVRGRVDAAAGAHAAGLTAGLTSARRSQALVLASTLLLLVLGALLTAALAAVMRYKRSLDESRQAELERLRGAALTDSLTGLGNHRAFHERLDGALDRDVPICLVLLDLDGLKRTNDSEGHQAGDELIVSLAAALSSLADEHRSTFRIGGDEFAVVLEGAAAIEGFSVTQELRGILRAPESGRPVSATAGIAPSLPSGLKDDLIRRADVALIAAKRSHRGVLVYSRDLEDAAKPDPDDRHHLSTLATALARAVDAKDAYTHSHCETVAELCAMIATELGLAPERVARIRLAGLLHDVGKIGVSDAILQKPSSLDDEELAVMRTHSTLGCHIVSAADLDEEAGWILHHHERLDGGGYPDGLAGAAVPLESRIIMVADAFEAITADRPYRDRSSVEDALAELRRHRGTQFDPHCLEALERIVTPQAGGVSGLYVAA
jgi:diguanylate cyclase (GGDEF)-like protein/putative nucleotidyltransferase with HDIG domain